MKLIYLIAVLAASHQFAFTQTNAIESKPAKKDNIEVKKIADSEESSSFLIWLRHGVKEHKHINHTEVIYVIDGTGTMTLGDQIIKLKPGDFLEIPKNTWHSVKVTSKERMKVISVQAPKFTGADRVFRE